MSEYRGTEGTVRRLNQLAQTFGNVGEVKNPYDHSVYDDDEVDDPMSVDQVASSGYAAGWQRGAVEARVKVAKEIREAAKEVHSIKQAEDDSVIRAYTKNLVDGDLRDTHAFALGQDLNDKASPAAFQESMLAIDKEHERLSIASEVIQHEIDSHDPDDVMGRAKKIAELSRTQHKLKQVETIAKMATGRHDAAMTEKAVNTRLVGNLENGVYSREDSVEKLATLSNGELEAMKRRVDSYTGSTALMLDNKNDSDETRLDIARRVNNGAALSGDIKRELKWREKAASERIFMKSADIMSTADFRERFVGEGKQVNLPEDSQLVLRYSGEGTMRAVNRIFSISAGGRVSTTQGFKHNLDQIDENPDMTIAVVDNKALAAMPRV